MQETIITKIENDDTESSNEFYKIEFPTGKEITTKVTPAFRNDLTLFGIISEEATPEDQQKMLEGYLIKAASEFVAKGLDKEKQDEQGKFESGGLDDELGMNQEF